MFGMAGLVHAAPVDLKQVSADAVWLAHLDADAMRASTVWDKRYARHDEKCRAIAAACDELREASQVFNAARDLRSITLYGPRFAADSGVAIVRANFDEAMLKVLAEAIKKQPDYRSVKHGRHGLHAWTHAKGTQHEHPLAVCFAKPDLLIVGASSDNVTRALDVLDGVKPNIVNKGSPLAYPMPIETLFVARAVGPWTDVFSAQSPILQRSRWIGVALCEKDSEKDGKKVKEAFLTADLAARDSKVAEELRSVIEVALTEALATDDADVADVINTLEVFVREKIVSVDVHGAGDTGYYLDEIVDWLVRECHRSVVSSGAQ
jgi:hypothetical protein